MSSKTMDANAREIHNIEFLAGLDTQLIQGQEILRDRLALVPNGWRNFRLAVTTTEKVLNGIYETLPMRTLRHMDRLCKCGEVVIRPKPIIKLLDDAQIVLSEDLRMLINMVVAAECAVCLKSPPSRRAASCARRFRTSRPQRRFTTTACAAMWM